MSQCRIGPAFRHFQAGGKQMNHRRLARFDSLVKSSSQTLTARNLYKANFACQVVGVVVGALSKTRISQSGGRFSSTDTSVHSNRVELPKTGMMIERRGTENLPWLATRQMPQSTSDRQSAPGLSTRYYRLAQRGEFTSVAKQEIAAVVARRKVANAIWPRIQADNVSC